MAELVDALDLKSNSRFGSVGSIPTIRTTYLCVESWLSWSKALVLKTSEVHASKGSNPLLSAITTETPNLLDFIKFFINNLSEMETFFQQKKQKENFLT